MIKKKTLQEKRRVFISQYCKWEIENEKKLKKSCETLKKEIKNAKLDMAFVEMTDQGGITNEKADTIRIAITQLHNKLNKKEKAWEEAKKQLFLKRLEAQETKEYQNIKSDK